MVFLKGGDIVAHDRIEPCKFYICKGCCTKGRNANQSGYCQKCNKYVPRIRRKHLNLKKQKIENIRKNEKF